MSTAEYFIPTVASRVKAAVTVAALLLWWLSHPLWLSPLAQKIDTCAVCSSLWATRLVAVYITLLPMPLCLWLAHSADQILKSGQNPPPRSWLLFKVRLYRGLRAKLAAYGVAVVAFATALAPGFLAHHFSFAYIFCIAEDCGCNQEPKHAKQACGPSAKRNEA